MRLLKKPSLDIKKFYATCISGVGSADLKIKFTKFTNKVITASQRYDVKSQQHRLYELVEDKEAKSEYLLTEPFITKKEFKCLYEYQVAKENRPGRTVYRDLLITINRKCPFCSVGTVKNLDHFLPKAHFPIFAVTPVNLVPSCRDCNQDKKDDFSVKKKKQTLHPYFDDVTKVKWLIAWVSEESIPPIVSYYTEYPESELMYSQELADKVEAHFEAYNLDEKFTNEAAEMLCGIHNLCMDVFNREGSRGLKSYLIEQKESYEQVHLNSWQGAMYDALANSVWYFEGEFIRVKDRKYSNQFNL